MKNKIGIVIIALIIISGAIALSSRSSKIEAQVGNSISQPDSSASSLSGSGTYSFDTVSSKIIWSGTKTMIKGWVDTGDITMQSGSVTLNSGKITEGDIVVNMSTITATKTGGGKGEEMLSGHLKSKDFFDVAAFPTSEFSLTSISQSTNKNEYIVKGDMTIKGITKAIEFPAVIYMKNGELILDAKIVLDRSQFNVKYGSKTFFNDLGDKAVDNDFTLTLELVAKK